jgi:hypothetical protein
MSVPTFAIGYYVVDEVGKAGALSGPFKTPAEAEADLREYNIAEDCGVWHRDTNGQLYPYPGYSLEEA